VIGAQHLAQEDPQGDERREDAVDPGDASLGQRLGDEVFGEDFAERQRLTQGKLASEELHLRSQPCWIRGTHAWGLLALRGSLSTPIYAAEAVFAYVILCQRLADEPSDIRGIDRCHERRMRNLLRTDTPTYRARNAIRAM
jgi:hypothetical protein